MKKRRILITTIVILLVLAIAIVAIILWPRSNSKQEVKVINKIENYGYTLEDNETSIHKKYFEDLVLVLKKEEVDEEEYAKLVTKLFVSDFYNLNNKLTKNDVGGTQYIYTVAKDNMILNAKDTMYKYIESNINNNRIQKLPIVTDVEIVGIEQIEFEYGTKTDNHAYKINVKWTYKEDMDYQDEAVITLIHEENKLNIAQLD